MTNETKKYVLHAVEGFNPYDHLEPCIDQATGETMIDNTGETLYYLPAKMQETWFRLKYPEGKIALEEIEAPHDCVKFRARIYQDRKDPENEYLSEAQVKKREIENAAFPPYESCQTNALAKALTYAGFGCEIKAFAAGETMKLGDVESAAKAIKNAENEHAAEAVFSPDEQPAGKSTRKQGTAKEKKKATDKPMGETKSSAAETSSEEKESPNLEDFMSDISNPYEAGSEESTAEEKVVDIALEIPETEMQQPEEKEELSEHSVALQTVFTVNEDVPGPLKAHSGKTLKEMLEKPDTANLFKVVANSPSFKKILPENVYNNMMLIYSTL